MALFVIMTMLLAACGTETPTATQVAPAVATNTTAPAPAATNTTAPAAADATNTTAPAAAEPTNTTAAAVPTDTAVAAAGDATATLAPPTATTQPTVVSSGEGCAAGATRVTWFVGVGAGSDAQVIPLEEDWVDNFNKSQTEACVILQVVPNVNAVDTLRTLIAGGNAPDIVGPTGKAGRASFQGSWTDVAPLAEAGNVDLSAYDPALLEFTKDEGVLVGLPFALFPSFIYYNKDLFDEARLPYPPHKVGEMYDGKEWNLDTMTELAKKLTVDANGEDATSDAFDPENITTWGFYEQFTDARGVATLFGGGLPYDEANPKNEAVPDYWEAAWKWFYGSVWTDHISPNADAISSDLLGAGNPFSSGNVAMAHTHTWYTCCFDKAALNWDIAVMPVINGKITAKLHGDTFAILEDSKNKQVAFNVMSQMVKDAELYQIYGGLPAVEAERPAFFAAQDLTTGENKIDWSVAEAMLAYPDIPNHEAWTPNLIKVNAAFGAFRTLLEQTPDLDVDAEITKFEAQLDALFKEAQ
jgi:multiple sugar transport system substrate-binding protein